MSYYETGVLDMTIFIMGCIISALVCLIVCLLIKHNKDVTYLSELSAHKTEMLIAEMKQSDKLALALDRTELDAAILEGVSRELEARLAHMDVLQIERLEYIAELEVERNGLSRMNSDMRHFMESMTVEYERDIDFLNN